MDSSINFLLATIAISVGYFVYIFVDYTMSKKKICGFCMNKGVVSSCCSSPITYIYEGNKKDITHTICEECGTYCNIDVCRSKHT